MRAQRNVVVDLSGLVFADSSLMLDLGLLARRLRVQERRLLLRAPQPQVLRVIELVGLSRLPGITLESIPAALA